MKGRTFILSLMALGLMVTSTISSANAAPSPRNRSIGYSWNLGAISASQEVSIPHDDEQGAIVGIAIAGSNDHVYVWHADGTVSSGSTLHFEYHHGRVPFELPEGKNTWDIIAMAIAGSSDTVYTWYADGTVSAGWSQDLGAYSDPQPFNLPEGYSPSSIVGIGIAGSDDHVYAWYSDGRASEGWTQNLGYYESPYNYSTPNNRKIGHIIDIAIAGSNDRVYTWYHDVEKGSGHSNVVDQVDAAVMDVLRRYRLPGLGISASKDGRVILEKGYGFANFDTQKRMNTNSRCRIGSVSKVITALSAMHLHEHDPGFSVSQPVYSPWTLSSGSYSYFQDIGVSRHQPVVAKAISLSDHVYTWNHDGTATEGTSVDPDYYGSPYAYDLAPTMNPEDVRAIAIAPNGWTWVWYDDGTYGAGQTWDLDKHVQRDTDVTVSLPQGYSMAHIVGVDFAPNGTVYVWYDNGMQSAGTTSNFAANIQPRSYTTAPGKSRYEIRGMGIAKSNSRVYTWFSDGTVYQGWSRNLDHYAGPYNYATPGYAYDASQDWPQWYDDMRIDHLMSHSSGLSRSGDIVGSETMFGLPEDLLDYAQVHQYQLATRKLLFEPGGGKRYSNHGMGLVGHIVAEVSGTSFRNYARNNIIDPLGLNIRAHSSGQSASLDTYRHEYIDGIPDAYIDDATNDLGLGAGGWKSSAGDLVRLMLATDGNPNHPDILSAGTIATMESRPYPGASDYAHGWSRNNAGKLAHNGRLGGGTTYIAKYPEDYIGGDSDEITVAVCTNISISDARGGSSPLKKLAGDIAVAVDSATIGSGYDLH